jgi:ComF family protein
MKICRGCRGRSLAFDAAWAACLYNDPVRQLVHLYKYKHKTVLRYHFFQILFTFITAYRIPLNKYHWIVPVPLHPARLRERGYNQSQLLAQLLAGQYDTPISADNLQRVRNTESQSVLSQKERWTNIQQAFRIKQPRTFKDTQILLIDDLLTTGATASEAARTLKEAGAKRVDVLTLAVTDPEDDKDH